MSRKINYRYLLAVDPSLSASGWVLFDLKTERPLGAGVISPPGPRCVLAERFDVLQAEVKLLYTQLTLGADDIVICEGPAPLVKNPESALKVERVRSIFESVARGAGAHVPGRLNPRTVQTELLGMRGKQLSRVTVKHSAREAASRLFGRALETAYIEAGGAPRRLVPQDVVDAALIGFLALSKVKLAVQCEADLSSVFTAGVNSTRWGTRGRNSGWSEAQFGKFSAK